MKERQQLDIDRRIIAYVGANPGATFTGVGEGLIKWYSPVYTRNRILYLESIGRIIVDRQRSRKANYVRLRENSPAVEA